MMPSNSNGHPVPLVQAAAMKTVLVIAFPNGRVVGLLVNPLAHSVAVAADGELFNELRATPLEPSAMAPFGMSLVPVGGNWTSPDPAAILGRFPVSPTLTDVVIRHIDGSAETVRFEHAAGGGLAMTKPGVIKASS